MKVANSTIDCYVSALKHFLFTKQEQLTEIQEKVLRQLQAARRRRYPDKKRVTGAMNHERTSIFVDYLTRLLKDKEDDRVTEENYQWLLDAARMLDGCALRFFQLLKLSKEGFFPKYDKKGRLVDYYMEVEAKGAEKRVASDMSGVDNKQVNPLYREYVMGRVNRYKKNTYLFAGFQKHKKLFAELVNECSMIEGWLVEHSL